MRKIQRNEICPCGSGKKFKKCCGISVRGNVTAQQINTQLDYLHQSFISFAKKNFQDQIYNKIEELKANFIKQDKDLSSVYHTGLIIWILLNVPIINNQTVFQIFYSQYKGNNEQLTKKIFEKWPLNSPFVYEILKVNRKGKRVKIKDIVRGNTYEVPYDIKEEYKFVRGSFIIGTLVPFIGLDNFFYSMVNLYEYDRSQIINLTEKYLKNNQLTENFPSFLQEALLMGLQEDNKEREVFKDIKIFKEDSLYEQVAILFTKHLEEKKVETEIITNGITLWEHFCNKNKPSFSKIEPFAAALEYLVQKVYLANSQITQSQLSKEYQTSTGTISNNYRKLVKGLKTDYEEIAKL